MKSWKEESNIFSMKDDIDLDFWEYDVKFSINLGREGSGKKTILVAKFSELTKISGNPSYLTTLNNAFNAQLTSLSSFVSLALNTLYLGLHIPVANMWKMSPGCQRKESEGNMVKFQALFWLKRTWFWNSLLMVIRNSWLLRSLCFQARSHSNLS